MFELVPSKFMRKAYKDMGFQFTDFEKATLIWNAPGKSVQEKLNALKELADKTDDDYLRKQIVERLNYENKTLEVFKDNSSGKYVYVVIDCEDYYQRQSIGFFGDYDIAFKYTLKYMKKYDVTCCIEKHQIISKDSDEYESQFISGNANTENKYLGYQGLPKAEMMLSVNGDIDYLNSREALKENKTVSPFIKDRFENHFVDIHYPVKSVMCVRNIITGKYGM